MRKIIAAALLPLCLLLATLGSAQTTTPASQTQSTGQDSKPTEKPANPGEKKDENSQDDQKIKSEQKTGVSNDRLFVALPNFLTVHSKDVPPLTAGEKFKVVLKSAVDPGEFAWFGLTAAIAQANNTNPQYGQGGMGYAKRYGTNFGDGEIQNVIASAVFPSILKQDPRYYWSGEGSFGRRTVYAASRVLVAHGDNGKKQLNWSELLGSFSAAAISTYTYHSHSDRNFTTIGKVSGTNIMYDSLSYTLKEFWPDVMKKFKKHKPAESASTPAKS